MEISEPARRRVEEATSQRHCTVKYRLNIDKKSIQVCQKHIISIFNVTKRRIQMIIEKLKSGKNLNDLRGKHSNRPHKIKDDDITLAKQHIASFPSQESHYGRNSSKKLCLNPDLNISKMHKMFLQKYPESKVNLHRYRMIFNENFNLRFGVPRSDTCTVCDKLFVQLSAADDEQTRNLIMRETQLHHVKAEKAYKTLNEDVENAKNNNNVIVLCVDLEQVLFTPNLTHSDVYYQRQYSNYNLAIHSMGNNEVTMNVWHETIAKRGSAEISSCIVRYILNTFNKLETHQQRSLTVWSDRCTGQNNNWKMIALYHYLVCAKYFTEVNQKFLMTGHSFLPCDRDFALIEKCKKTANLLVPQHVWTMIENARPSKPFHVVVMEQDDFIDLSPAEQQLNKKSKLIKVSQGRWIQIRSDDPSQIHLRKTHNLLEAWTTDVILKKKPLEVDVHLNLKLCIK